MFVRVTCHKDQEAINPETNYFIALFILMDNLVS